MNVVVTDAYSTTNIGDGELVRLTLQAVGKRYAVQPTVLATDPGSFEGDEFDSASFIYKPLSRQVWRAKRGLDRYLWLQSEATALLLMAAVTLAPRGTRPFLARSVANITRRPWLRALAHANVVVGVGGGYIGDKYLRESIVTAICLKFSECTGASVETMPLSVSSAESRLLRLVLRRTKGVQWRSREERTHSTLHSLGLTSKLVPDLAWLDAGEPTDSSETRSGMAIAPVGSAFYSDSSHTPKVWATVAPLLESLPPGSPVRLVAMHRWDRSLGDGQDDRACDALREMISRARPDLEVQTVNGTRYVDVRTAMARSQFAVCERLHAALAAATSATPVLVVAYEPKHEGVLRLAGLQAAISSQVPADLEVSSTQMGSVGANQRKLVESAVMGPCAYSI